MVRCANQFFIVRSAHGLWPANELKLVLRRRWLYMSGLYLYSRPYVNVHLRTSGHVYSRPCAESEGAQRSPLGVILSKQLTDRVCYDACRNLG